MLEKELSMARELSLGAGKIILSHYDNEIEVTLKNKTDPVTLADTDSNTYITENLARVFPEDGILSEESKDDLSRLNKSRVWIVDPMDGTREFIDKVGQFATMIGLVVDGVPVLGVVYQPTTGMMLTAVKGEGAFMEQEGQRRQMSVTAVSQTGQMRLVVSRSHRSHLVGAIMGALGIEKEVRSGSVGLKVGLLIRQESDLYIHPNSKTKEWDTAAPQIILEEAGGLMTDCWGNPMTYNKENVFNEKGFVASNNQCHAEIVEKMAPFLADMD